jgi:hypothetical protein
MARRRRIYEQRLRRTVVRLAACLHRVAPFHRQVLRLRAGLGERRSLSRVRVARRLGVRPEAVRGSERRGLRRLRAAHRSHDCGRPDFAATAALLAAPFEAVGGRALLGGEALSEPVATPGQPRSRRSGGRGGALGARGGAGTIPPPAQVGPLTPLDDPDDGRPEPAVLAALLAATLVLALMALRARRRAAADEPMASPPEQDPRDWEPPPPPWSRS